MALIFSTAPCKKAAPLNVVKGSDTWCTLPLILYGLVTYSHLTIAGEGLNEILGPRRAWRDQF